MAEKDENPKREPKGSIPGQLLRFHGKYATRVAREPLCTVMIEKMDGALGMSLGGGSR